MDSFLRSNRKLSETEVSLDLQISLKSECGIQFYDAVTYGKKRHHGRGHPVILWVDVSRLGEINHVKLLPRSSLFAR